MEVMNPQALFLPRVAGAGPLEYRKSEPPLLTYYFYTDNVLIGIPSAAAGSSLPKLSVLNNLQCAQLYLFL